VTAKKTTATAVDCHENTSYFLAMTTGTANGNSRNGKGNDKNKCRTAMTENKSILDFLSFNNK
jgi:hypothetical protein